MWSSQGGPGVQGAVHPMRRQIFANTVGRICKLNLTLRLMPFHAHDAHWMQRETLIE